MARFVDQSTDAKNAGAEIAARRQLLDRLELEGLLVPTDALQVDLAAISATSVSGAVTSWCADTCTTVEAMKTSGTPPRDPVMGRRVLLSRNQWTATMATLRKPAKKALRLDGFWSIIEGLAVLAHDIKGLLEHLGWREQARPRVPL